jgi:hypothetical protein
MNRFTVVLAIGSCTAAEVSGSVQFYRVIAWVPHTRHGNLTAYCGPAIAAWIEVALHAGNQLAQVEIEVGPLGFRIVSITTPPVTE